jgi:glycosyltransferase involved in cell wall biosynthesis
MPPDNHDVAESVRRPGLAAIVVVGEGDLGALETSIRGIAGNSVLPGLHVCFVTRGAMAADALAELNRIARSLDGRHPWTMTPSARDRGFGDLLSEVSAAHPTRDVVLIAAGADLPFAWDARLAKAAYAAPDVAAAVPMCDVSPLHALVDGKLRADARTDATRIDRSAYSMGDRSYYEVPGIHPVCAYLRRDPLVAALPFVPAGAADPRVALDALAKRWRATGFCCALCDYIYVGYAGEAPAMALPQPDFDETAFLQHHPLGALRRAVNEAIERGLPPVSTPGLDHRPVQLHIMHFWGGGLERWVRDFGRADPSRINMILATYRIGETGGQRIVLYSDPTALVPVRTWDIARPIRSTAAGSTEYRRILTQVVDEFEVEAIIVSSLIGHSLDALTQPRKTLVVCHDFYPVCQAINPQFGTTCVRCTQDDLRRCARSNPLNDLFDDQTSEEWHEMRGLYVSHLLDRRIEMAVPSPSVAATLKQLAPRLADVPMHVIPHGADQDALPLALPPRAAGAPLRIVVLGRMSAKKGAQLLRSAAEALRGLAEITLVGCGAEGVKLAQECGWNFIERYAQDALPGILREIAPHAGLLASIVPESFSYTLSELTDLGVPPIVTALGSFSDRVVNGENGFLFEPDVNALLGLLRRLHAQPELLERVARNLAAQPRGRSTADMVNDYRALLPLAARPIARFRVGVGRQTALTEPYRQLTAAYAELTGAYGQSAKAYEETRAAFARTLDAYEHTRAAFDRANGDLGRLRETCEAFVHELGTLNVMTHPWRARRAAELVIAFRDRIGSLGADATAPGTARSDGPEA